MRRTIALRSAHAAITIIAVLAGFLIAGTAGASGTSSVSGTAFDDRDHDGAHDAGEPGFAGHAIYVLTADRSTLIAQGTTDANGHYSFEGLTDATYTIEYSSSTWTPLRNDWFPTTTPLATVPRTQVTVAGATSFDFGLRQIVRSTDVAAPISDFVGPSGLRVQSYVDVVSAQTIHDVLATGSLGQEASHTTVRFGLSSSSTTATSSVSSNGTTTSFSALSWVTYASYGSSGTWTTLAHEYGHAWANYHRAMTQQASDFGGYLTTRGLDSDARVGSSYAWEAGEMIAEDYRQLLGPPATRSAPQMNRDIPEAADVAGLAQYLAETFTASTTQSDTVAPTATLVSPSGGSTVAGMITIESAASDDRTVAGSLDVVVVVDGSIRVTATYDATTGRFRAAFDTRSLADGPHSITVVATDESLNEGASASSGMTVMNSTTTTKTKSRTGGGRPRR